MNAYPMSTKALYQWVEDQVADWGDKGVAWQNIVSFGVTIAGIEAVRLDCAIADLINARRLAVRQRDNMLVYRD
jgi:hypothetical protein